jgi:precorrin-3B synthase
MNAPLELRRGWCPSLSRPMRSGDGLLVRLNISGPVLPAELALALSDSARRYGNGLVDLTQRANLQLRGVAGATLPYLRERLAAVGREDNQNAPASVGNILASPLAGFDSHAKIDIAPILAALRKRLATSLSLAALPAKFCALIDDGGRLGLTDIDADIRFEAVAAPGGPRFVIALGGRSGEGTTIGICSPADVPDAAMTLASMFIRLSEGDERLRRMRHLVRQIGAVTLANAARSAMTTAAIWVAQSDIAVPVSTRGSQRHVPPVGFHPLDGATGFLGVGAPLGRLTCRQLDAIAHASLDAGAHLRMTPWRCVLLAGLEKSRAGEFERRLAGVGLIVDPTDARLAITACSGAPACAHATVATRRDALTLAELARRLAPQGVVLHLSGCAKGCARTGPSMVTLVGREGRYDIVIDGPAGGTPLRERLTLAEVTSVLAGLSAGVSDAAASKARYLGAPG